MQELANFGEVKPASFLLAIYILFLTGVPCCAFDNCKKDSPTTENTESKKHNPAKEDDCNNCSPFFNCNCCSGFIVQERFIIEPVIVLYQTGNFHVFKRQYQPEYVSSFWQPPQPA